MKLPPSTKTDAIGYAYALFAKVHPQNAHFVVEAVTAKVISRLLPTGLQLDQMLIKAWADRHPS